MMTDDELRLAIIADADLKARAILGNDGGISRAMTTPNTAPALSIAGLLGGLSAASIAKIAVNPNVTDLRDKVLAGDLAGVSLWAELFAGGGIIEPAEYQAVQAAIAAAVPNGVTVTVEQVSRAMLPHRINGKAGAANWQENI